MDFEKIIEDTAIAEKMYNDEDFILKIV